MFEVLSLLSLAMIFTTIAPHLPGEHWLIRVWEFPRVQQIFIIGAIQLGWIAYMIAVGPTTASMVFLGLLVLALGYQVSWVYPYTSFGPKEVTRVKQPQQDRVFSIMTSNVYMYNDNYRGLIDLVSKHKPDMLVTLESNKDWEDAMTPIHEDYPYRLACPLENLYGMHLYSRVPFKDEKIRYIIEDDVPSMQVIIEIEGEPVVVYLLHPKPPSPTENKSAAPRDEELILVGQEIVNEDRPVIIAGDLNDVAWSPTTRNFRKQSRARDPRLGRGFFNTFHAKHQLVRWPLDHVFHSDHFDLVKIERLPGYGSDHFPLYTSLQLTRNCEQCESSSAPETSDTSPDAERSIS